MLTLDEIVAACGHISATDDLGQSKTGTGYLIACNRIATCAHVVEHATTGSISINFYGIKQEARVLRTNADSDCAILELNDPLADVQPLRLGGKCNWKATWDSYGFPSLARGAGVTMSGIVSNPKAKDDRHAFVLELTSPEVAAGMAAPIHGLSGSPVIVDGVVVGHLKRFLSDPENPLRPAYGKVYATPSDCVSNLLNDDNKGDSFHLFSFELTPSTLSPVDPPQLGSNAHMQHLQKIRELLQKWPSQDMPPGLAGLVASESLIQLGEPNEALNILATVPASVKNDQLRALALAKIGLPSTLDASIRILENLRKVGHFDAETGGLLGGEI